MTKEKVYTEIQIVCDGCGKIKKEPIAMTGNYDSGWINISYHTPENKYTSFDLCDICYPKYMKKVLETIDSKKRIKIMKELKDDIVHSSPNYPGGWIDNILH